MFDSYWFYRDAIFPKISGILKLHWFQFDFWGGIEQELTYNPVFIYLFFCFYNRIFIFLSKAMLLSIYLFYLVVYCDFLFEFLNIFQRLSFYSILYSKLLLFHVELFDITNNQYVLSQKHEYVCKFWIDIWWDGWVSNGTQ